MSSPLKTKTVEQLKWAFLAVLVIILFFVVLWRATQGSLEADEFEPTTDHTDFLKQQEEYELRSCNMEVANLAEYARKERQNIETWYAENLANLKQWEKERLEQLDREEKIAWARYNQDVKKTTSKTRESLNAGSYETASTHMVTDSYAMTKSYTSTDGLHSQTTDTYVVGNPARIYELEMRRIENERDAIKSEFLKLKRKRDRYLAESESYVQRRIDVINVKKRRVKENTTAKLQEGPGMIDAISFSGSGERLIIFEGKIYHEGDVVNGFNIHKIFADRVEFEKNGQISVQKLQ